MQRTLRSIGGVLLVSLAGVPEVLTAAEDYIVGSDVILESAVKEIKSIPSDAVELVGAGINYVTDEVNAVSNAVAAIFADEKPLENVKESGVSAVDEAWDVADDMLFRSYTVSDEIGSLLMSVKTKSTEDAESPFVDVRAFFEDIDFTEKMSASYLPQTRTLFVRQTSANLASIEDVLDGYKAARRNLMGQQVEIEAKFVEVSQSALNELGFSWSNVTGSDGGNVSLGGDMSLTGGSSLLSGGLRSSSTAFDTDTSAGTLKLSRVGGIGWDLLISALEQSSDTDVLSAPRVVTRFGSTAIIQVGEEQMMPKSFEVDNRSTSPWVLPTDWNKELLGVKLEVTPQLREDGLINLEIAPEVKDLIGYDSYELVPNNVGGSTSGNPGRADGSLPYYRIRKMETRVTVADGSTVGMGGLIYDKMESFSDKVPLLGSIPFIGQLFRSEGTQSVKRNLMVFVTATQVDVKGRRASDLALEK